jgi:hypothetical protein
MSNFKDWTRDKLLDRFGLERNFEHPVLSSWLAMPQEIKPIEREILLYDLETTLRYIDFWNEEEVKIKLIATIIRLVGYDSKNLSGFADRTITSVVDGEELSGKPDFMVARGKQEIKAPIFFIHEYKKEAPYPSQGEIIEDPAGQLLAAMLVAYQENLQVKELKEKPLCGAYVVGRQWYFVILQGREYGISLAYDSTYEEHLLDIFRILKANRQQIREIWGE